MSISILPKLDLNRPIFAGHGGVKYTNAIAANPQMLLDGFFLNDRYQLRHKIGAGTYGLIYLVEDLLTGQRFAAKMILTECQSSVSKAEDVEDNKKRVKKKIFDYFISNKRANSAELNLDYIRNEGMNCPFLREIALHLRVHEHPNIITIHKVLSLDNIAIVILMDYYDGGDLFDNIVEKKIFENHPYYQDKQLLMKNTMLQLVDAVEYCSSKGIYHCDLKPENIMVRYQPGYRRTNDYVVDYNEIQVVLIDFGLAMNSDIICCNVRRGSSFYMAPERITNYCTCDFIKSRVDLNEYKSKESDDKSSLKYFPTIAGDIWSLGVLFLNITCAKNPWPSASVVSTTGNKVFQAYLRDNKVLSTIFPISNEFISLLGRIFRLGPNERITLEDLASQIVGCDFFSERGNCQLPTPTESDDDNDFIWV